LAEGFDQGQRSVIINMIFVFDLCLRRAITIC
jgi:hypothetical protein